MERVTKAIDGYMDKPDPTAPHVFREAAKEWAVWCIENTNGTRLTRGLSLAAALTDYANLDDEPRQGK